MFIPALILYIIGINNPGFIPDWVTVASFVLVLVHAGYYLVLILLGIVSYAYEKIIGN